MNTIPYSSLVRSLMYGMIFIKPDLSYPFSVLSRYMANLVRAHWESLKWLLRYLQTNIKHGLMYGRGNNNSRHYLRGYIDPYFSKCLATRSLVSSYSFNFLDGIIIQKYRLQYLVCLLTIKAKLIVAIEAKREAIWLH